MTDSDIIVLFKQALASVAPAGAGDFDRLSLDTSIADLELDSVSTMEMVGYVEEQVGGTFSDEDLAQVTHLRELAALVRRGADHAA